MFSLIFCFKGPLIHPWDGTSSPVSPLLTAPLFLGGWRGTAPHCCPFPEPGFTWTCQLQYLSPRDRGGEE